MKAFRLLTILLSIAVCVGVSSCGDDELEKKPLEPVKDEITISSASFDFEANGGEKHCPFQPTEIGLQLLPIQLMVRIVYGYSFKWKSWR